MPTWKDLVTPLVDRLYPPKSGYDKKRSELEGSSSATSTAMRLADEFVAVFGRSALEELIVQRTPDADHEPGLIHNLLVQLPWTDILTTNYDTLIERAAQSALGKRYTVVQTPAELPSSSRPRIVKLHGSFPSVRPFIFTEEDFRTYPRMFAPFINLAQQTVLENILCLVGFSGDDPNFLAWTGWVRDHLTEYAPRIYLCGLLNLTNSQRLLLQSRGVIPVDLTPIFAAKSHLDTATRHRFALEWFLRSLKGIGPNNPTEWPTQAADNTNLNPDLPPLLTSSYAQPRIEREAPDFHGVHAQKGVTILQFNGNLSA